MEIKYTKNSKIHHALDNLSHGTLTEQDLKRKIDYSQSMTRFNQHIIIPLINDKLIKRDETVYRILPKGEEVLNDLGRIKIKMPSTTKHVPIGKYDGKELTAAAVRIAADDHFKHPSRRGDKLFYRDGRVEAV